MNIDYHEFLRLMILSALPFLFVGVFILLYFWLSRPLRKQEESRQFLQLLQIAVENGTSLEQALIRASSTRDKSLPLWLHLFAAHLEAGSSFGDALRESKKMVPRPLAELLQVGIKNGTLPSLLKKPEDFQFNLLSRSTHGLELLYLAFLSMIPFFGYISVVLILFVIPKFKALVTEMEINSQQILDRFGLYCSILTILTVAVCVIVYPLVYKYSAFPLPLPRAGRRAVHWMLFRFSHVKTEAVRRFASSLALFLDLKVPEQAAVLQAAEMTGNAHFMNMAKKAASDLEHGIKLTVALNRLTGMDQIAARCEFAATTNLPFQQALEGWIQYLKAKESQQEQTFYTIFSSSITILNGIVVGLLACAFFGALISVLESI
jgi:type II secretory pathway component PulF